MNVTPEKFAEERPEYEYIGEVSKAGVFFAEFTRNGDPVYARLFDGVIHEPFFTEVGRDGNYTYGIVEGEMVRRMVDDDGVHDRLDEYK